VLARLGLADIARHVIHTHCEPSLLEFEWHPVMWRATSARPYRAVGRHGLRPARASGEAVAGGY
jgi:hypothetical protein